MAKENSTSSNVVVSNGIGAALAAALSYCKWHGFWLAVGHSFLGWVYVFYSILRYGIPVIHRY